MRVIVSIILFIASTATTYFILRYIKPKETLDCSYIISGNDTLKIYGHYQMEYSKSDHFTWSSIGDSISVTRFGHLQWRDTTVNLYGHKYVIEVQETVQSINQKGGQTAFEINNTTKSNNQ